MKELREREREIIEEHRGKRMKSRKGGRRGH